MKWLVVVLAISFCASCTDNKEVPDDIIPQKKMEKIFWDMIQADRYSSLFLSYPEDSIRSKEEAFIVYEKVFRVHGITQEEFKESYTYYMGRPDLSKVMFDSIAAQAERKRPEIYNPDKKGLVE